ncbi:MAG TPA: MetQ/NlpA family ABC transporter substrate-binding protein [Gammaproteobacteria bacterium]|nr:MetQ/NlpA family ABC transporter substrate-binding protein [Gammaproteobacteria bacterium]
MVRLFFVFLLSVFLTACGSKEPANQIRVGVMSGPESELMQIAKNVALEKYGLTVKIVEFSDYNLPNQALADGSIDINMFQHMPFFVAWNNVHHAPLVPVAKGFIYPMGIYSYKVDRVSDLKPGSIIAIPNDPTNEARALLLLQKAKLITLKPNVTIDSTRRDIVSNPLNFQIKSLDAAQLVRVLPDVDAAVINTNFAIPGGLSPTRGDNADAHYDAIYLEDRDSLYANIFVSRKSNQHSQKVQELVAAFQSPQVVTAANNIFKGSAIKAW